ncbi:cobalamin B12-binding domain-containing protein [Alkalibacter rhizosphaerae]|uniref:Cobalamin B12-binding domain-containing protein n=1 Tax=Alkalibacter rhizosphaerae TaxID=2815577 RepID=A0A974XFE3_9FIRM|nr:cobalamin-dependent protein [Alkalibacter rhizosphaerae]QSX07725.1 cobalamin B12-binding domain-containing protein [Alkalibacter rhizosphaerae]
MDTYYATFRRLLEEERKDEAIAYSLELIRDKKVTIVDFYEQILAKTMNSIECHNDEKSLCIWKEHVRSAICRTIIESLYPMVLEERNRNYDQAPSQKVAVICPDGEYHDMGARIVSDYFTLLNWEVIFVGNSTPKEEFVSVSRHLELEALAISVTNPYNLVAAKRTIDLLREKSDRDLKIYLGGYGFTKVADWKKDFHADGLVRSFQELKEMLEGGMEDVSL